MENYLRFSDYEIFGYLAAGFAGLWVWDFVFHTGWIIGTHWSAADGVAAVFFAYVVGHMMAWPAAWVFEDVLVRRVLRLPSQVLFREPVSEPGHGWRKVFPDYHKPLRRPIAERVLANAGNEGRADVSGEDLFWIAFAVSKRDPAACARMDQFLKLYGFCRNIGFIGVASSVLILVVALWRSRATGWSSELWYQLLWAWLALAAGVIMFYRYLKFYRLYAVEVFVGYAAVDIPPSEMKNES